MDGLGPGGGLRSGSGRGPLPKPPPRGAQPTVISKVIQQQQQQQAASKQQQQQQHPTALYNTAHANTAAGCGSSGSGGAGGGGSIRGRAGIGLGSVASATGRGSVVGAATAAATAATVPPCPGAGGGSNKAGAAATPVTTHHHINVNINQRGVVETLQEETDLTDSCERRTWKASRLCRFCLRHRRKVLIAGTMLSILMALFLAICIVIAQAKRRPVEIVTSMDGEYSQYSSGASLSAGGAISGSATGCVALAVPLCHKHRVPYSHSVPGHEVRADEVAKFEPMVQIKCSKLLALFVCTTLAPPCVDRGREVPPCRSLCEEVMRSCSFFMGVFSLKWTRISSCNQLPESSDRSICVGRNEIEKLRMSKERCDGGFRCDKSRCISQKWVCDGHYDCQDRSDELNCSRCPGEFRCSGATPTGAPGDCVAKSKVCDGTMDCADGSDERQCLQLNHRMGFVGEGRLEMFSTAAGGFVPVCAEEWLSSADSAANGRGRGQQLAEHDWSRNTCRLLGYDQVQETRIRDDSPSNAFIGGAGHPPLRFNPSTRNGIHAGIGGVLDGLDSHSSHSYPGPHNNYNLNSMGSHSSDNDNSEDDDDNNNSNNNKNRYKINYKTARQPSANDLRKFRKHLFDRQKETACASSGVSVYLKCTNFSCGRRAEDMRLSKPQSRIVGGSESPPGRWPWLVAVHGGSEHVFFCGGVLISSWWVLTAAHCAGNSTDPSGWLLQMGMTRRNSAQPSSTQSRHIQAVVKHPDFNNASLYNNDIALLLLSDPVNFDDFLRPLCLPPDEPLAPGTICTVVGWGKSHHDEDAEYNMVIHEVDVPIVDFDTCQGWYMKEDTLISETMICAGYAEGQKDACQGDSGGPLVCRTENGGPWFVAGIVSWGIKCAQPHLPGIYTNVPRYLDWIRDITANYGHPLEL